MTAEMAFLQTWRLRWCTKTNIKLWNGGSNCGWHTSMLVQRRGTTTVRRGLCVFKNQAVRPSILLKVGETVETVEKKYSGQRIHGCGLTIMQLATVPSS